MKRCSKCDQSKHNRCKRGDCECLCQFGDRRPKKQIEGMMCDVSQDKFFEDMNKEWNKIQDRNKPKKK